LFKRYYTHSVSPTLQEQRILRDTFNTGVSKRSLGHPWLCKKKKKRPLLQREEEFFLNSFWDLKKCLCPNPVFSLLKQKNHSEEDWETGALHSYTVKVKGVVQVCKNEFMAVYDLQNSRGHMNNIVDQTAEGRNVAKPDG
jgi:hypothetical protein